MTVRTFQDYGTNIGELLEIDCRDHIDRLVCDSGGLTHIYE